MQSSEAAKARLYAKIAHLYLSSDALNDEGKSSAINFIQTCIITGQNPAIVVDFWAGGPTTISCRK
jgi:hypothetical protein